MKRFLRWAGDAGIRAVKTFGQSALGVIVIDKATPLHSNWEQAAQVGVAAAVLSLLQNLAALNSSPAPADPSTVTVQVGTVAEAAPTEPDDVTTGGADVADDSDGQPVQMGATA